MGPIVDSRIETLDFGLHCFTLNMKSRELNTTHKLKKAMASFSKTCRRSNEKIVFLAFLDLDYVHKIISFVVLLRVEKVEYKTNFHIQKEF